MHKRNSIGNIPLLVGILLSIAIHGAAWYAKGIPRTTEATPMIQQGRTVVQLTLVPSRASQAAAPEPQVEEPTEPLKEEPVETPVEPQVEQALLPAPPTEPIVETPPEQPHLSAEALAKEEASTASPEQDASLLEEKGVTTEVQRTKASPPVYPRLSRRRGEEGTVTLSIEVLSNGQVGNISVIQSSGYRRLDEAALKAARKTTFTPAKQFGQNIDSTTELPFTFRLTDD